MEQLPKNLLPDEASPEWMNKGDNAWQLTAATLLGLQSIPGLVILYGSLVKKKWAINSAFMAMYAFAAVLVCWVGWAYRMSFGEKLIEFLGKPAIYKEKTNLVGPRSEKDRERFPPNNIILTLAGAGLLWMGWSGFNGGGPFAISSDASLAVLNTHVCTSTSLLTWLLLDTFIFGKPSVIGAVQGMITGLVCITPAAGVVQGWAAIIMGLISGSVPWYTMMVLHNKIKLLRLIDDPMAVFHTHALAGTLGGILTGFFAMPKLCRLFYMVPDWEKYIGLAYGLQTGRTLAGFRQMGVQVAGLGFVICLNIATTSIICWFIGLIVPLRLSEDELDIGDKAVHGEEAFAFSDDGKRFENPKHNSFYDAEDFSYVGSRSLGEVQMV